MSTLSQAGVERDEAARSSVVRGRERELGTIGSQLGLLALGRGSVTVFAGGAGSGKTRLLDEAARIARRASARVAAGVAERGDDIVPMNALMGALFGGPTPLLDVAGLPDARPERRYWLIQEMEALLEEAARVGPIMISLDDMQWIDSGTTAALDALTVRLAGLPIAWFMAFRPGEEAPETHATCMRLARAGALRLNLRPLDEASVSQIIADHVGGEADPGVLELADSARGTPFWLTELLLGLQEEGLLRVEGGVATVRVARLPARVRDTMRERLARMSSEARSTATAASVLGSRFSFESLARMLNVTAVALLEPVGELLRVDLLVERGDALAFRHDILRQAVFQSVPLAARAALQRQAVDVLLAGGAPPLEVAAQLAASACRGDSEAIDVLIRASQTLGLSDPAAAASLSKRTLELIEVGDARRAPLVAETALLLHAAGQLDEGRAFAEEALHGLVSVEHESEVLFSISGMFALSADLRSEAGQRALTLPGLRSGDQSRHQARLIHNLAGAGRTREARQLADERGDELRTSGDPTAVFTVDLTEGILDYAAGNFQLALSRIEKAIRCSACSGADAQNRITQQWGVIPQEWYAEVLAVLDRYDEADAVIVSGLQSAQTESQAWAIRLLEKWRGRQMLQRGELSDAIAILEGVFATEETPGLGCSDAPALWALASASLHVGDQRLTGLCQAWARDALGVGTPEVRRYAAWVLAQQAMAVGDAETALSALLSLGPDAADSVLPFFSLEVTDDPQLVRLALAAGDRQLAQSAVARAADRARRNPEVASVRGAAAHAVGLLQGDAAAMRSAIVELESGPRRLALASALEDAAVLATYESQNDRAVALAGRALEVYAEMGARWDATRVRARLRRLGVKRRLIRVPERPTDGWEALTNSERSVVLAVTRGMTNRQAANQLFISPHTVNSHLRHVFTKLSVNSRVELTRVAAEHTAAGP